MVNLGIVLLVDAKFVFCLYNLGRLGPTTLKILRGTLAPRLKDLRRQTRSGPSGNGQYLSRIL
jgi:hypothetical protein